MIDYRAAKDIYNKTPLDKKFKMKEKMRELILESQEKNDSFRSNK